MADDIAGTGSFLYDPNGNFDLGAAVAPAPPDVGVSMPATQGSATVSTLAPGVNEFLGSSPSTANTPPGANTPTAGFDPTALATNLSGVLSGILKSVGGSQNAGVTTIGVQPSTAAPGVAALPQTAANFNLIALGLLALLLVLLIKQ